MSVSIEIKGIPEAVKFLKSKNKNIDKKLQLGINQAGIFVQGEVKSSIAGRRAEYKSVDTGRFLNSIDVLTGKEQVLVFSDLEYAKKLEFGTNFKNSPRKHFRNSASRSKLKVVEIIKKQVAKI